MVQPGENTVMIIIIIIVLFNNYVCAWNLFFKYTKASIHSLGSTLSGKGIRFSHAFLKSCSKKSDADRKTSEYSGTSSNCSPLTGHPENMSIVLPV